MNRAILKNIEDFNKDLATSLEDIQKLNSKIVCKTPESIRNEYDVLIEVIESKISSVNNVKVNVNKCIHNLEESKNKLAEIHKTLIEMTENANKKRVGTLQGLCKHTIKKHNIQTDDITDMILGFHNEADEIKSTNTASHGGKKLNKRKYTKRIKTGVGKTATLATLSQQ